MTGILILIGNLEDISPRVLARLGEVDALTCEDTRRTRKIFEHFKLSSPRRSASTCAGETFASCSVGLALNGREFRSSIAAIRDG